MSDRGVLAAIQAMEGWLDDPDHPLDERALECWNREFQEAVARAEKGPGWSDIVARAHDLAKRVEARTQALSVQRDAVRLELEHQAQGGRALRGYGSSAR